MSVPLTDSFRLSDWVINHQEPPTRSQANCKMIPPHRNHSKCRSAPVECQVGQAKFRASADARRFVSLDKPLAECARDTCKLGCCNGPAAPPEAPPGGQRHLPDLPHGRQPTAAQANCVALQRAPAGRRLGSNSNLSRKPDGHVQQPTRNYCDKQQLARVAQSVSPPVGLVHLRGEQSAWDEHESALRAGHQARARVSDGRHVSLEYNLISSPFDPHRTQDHQED